MFARRFHSVLMGLTLGAVALNAATAQAEVPDLPEGARLAFTEDWSSGEIDPEKWYVLRKKWGKENHGVVPENVSIKSDLVAGEKRPVLVCEAHGDLYDGGVTGLWRERQRVGGVIVSKLFFASGRFEVVMKLGEREPYEGGPADPRRPAGAAGGIWTYGYRWVHVSEERVEEFVPANPLYNPHMPAYNIGANEYISELDMPEWGKPWDYSKAMYNTFTQNRHRPVHYDIGFAADGMYHTYTTEWRTELKPLDGVTDSQVVGHDGYWWNKDKAIPFDRYLGNPLKRLGKDRYAVCTGARADHWIDGRKVASNTQFVPAMEAQLNLGLWLPEWAGPAEWKTARASYASIKVWQYGDEGDVRGIIRDDITNNFDTEGTPLEP